jgi:hypothetical protein
MSRRAGKAKRDAEPAGAYEVRFRLERSYRWWGLVFVAFASAAFMFGVVASEVLMVLLAAVPAGVAGIWLLRNDPREFLVIEPRRKRLQVVRVYGRRTKVRGEYRLGEFCRLELARYLSRPKGLRCMILLCRRDGTIEKVDDRLDDERLLEIGREAAAAAGLDFLDRGRIDLAVPARAARMDEVDDVDTVDEGDASSTQSTSSTRST